MPLNIILLVVSIIISIPIRHLQYTIGTNTLWFAQMLESNLGPKILDQICVVGLVGLSGVLVNHD